MTKVEKAKEIAEKAHGDQKYGDSPYVKHLLDVQAVLARHGITDEATLCAAFLHDAVEDTRLTLIEIEDEFGKEVADLVYRVTDEPGKNRKEKKIKTYPKIRGNEKATIIKLADRIANVEESIKNNPKKFQQYKNELPGLCLGVKVLGLSDTSDDLWNQLEILLG